MTTSYQDPRPVAASLKQPEIDKASLNDVLADQGWGVQAVNWVFEGVTGESLVSTIITPITGDWTKIRADGDAWRMVGNAMNDVSYNMTDAVGKVRQHWDGDAARAHEKYVALGWKAALFAEMGVAQLIAKGFDTVASGAEALGKQAARLLDYLVNKLLEAAATVWIPLAGWIKAAEMVWNAYQIYRRVMDIIDTVKKLIADVKSLFDAVGRVFSAIGKLKDADSLAEAMNATQEVAEAGRDVRNAVNDIRDDATSIKDSATEIADRGHDIGSKVREVYTPPGSDSSDGTKAAAATSVAPGGAPVSAAPTLHGGPDAPATHAATAAGPTVSAPPTLGAGSGSGGSGGAHTGGGSGGVPTGGGSGGVPTGGHAGSGAVPTGGHAGSGGVPTGGHGGPAAPPRVDTTHAAGAAPTAAPPSHHQTPVGGAMPMGAPPMAGGGGDSSRSSGSRPGSSAGSAWPTTPSGAPSGQPKPAAGGLPTPPSHGSQGTGLPAAPGQSTPGSRPGGAGLPTAPSGTGSHPTPGSAGTHPTPGSAGSHPTSPGSGGLPSHPSASSGTATAPAPSGTGNGHPTPSSGGGLPTPPAHPAPSGGGLPSPPGHPTPSSGGGLPSPPAHPTSSGGGLPSPPGHDTPSSGGGLPSPPGHPSPSTDHSTPNGSTDTKHHDAPDGTKPHDTTPHDTGAKPHDTDGKPHDTDGKPHDADGKPHDTDGKPHDTTHDTDGKPHDADGKPHDTDGKPHDGDGKDHHTDTSDADGAKSHDDHPDSTPADHTADHDADPKHDTDASGGHGSHDGNGDGSGNGGSGDDTPRSPKGHDLTPAFDHAAMAASGDGYKHQLEQIYPTEAERQRYVELSSKLSTELSPSEAREVANTRNQITVGSGDLVTKVLHQNAVDGYLKVHEDPTTEAARRQGTVAGSIARAEDVHAINNPMGLREGLALDDKGEGWTPIKDKADSAMQLRYHMTDDQAATANIPYGGPEKSDRDFSKPPTPGQEHREYQSPQEKAHYDASAKQMADAGGAAEPKRGRDPFTGTGSTGGGVPEWVAKPADLPDRAEIWEVKDGKERLHAVYEKGLGWYQLQDKESAWSPTPVK
ncbi:hypothetical protein ABZ345_04990 [Lentzea sp. NPDC005914]|uniref:hypothetical protein n=1 Tax=Lentzea sp. NPDC005914 TaxID=3154572 RepID=UPI0033EDB9D3